MVNEKIENIFLVNAPAGSGKTTTIRNMVNKRLTEHPEDNIMCITYTNRAAAELGKDIDSEHVFFGTIHSFFNSLLSSIFKLPCVVELYFVVYNDLIETRIANAENKINITESNKKYIEKFGKLDLDTVKTNVKEISYNESSYNSLYYGKLSHDDLITFARCAFEEFPILQKKIANKYQLLFIDEYQDTKDDVLWIFYNSIKDSESNLYLMGDRMQQIYTNYQGTFESEFKKLNTSFNLELNYRSSFEIVNTLNQLYNEKTFFQKANKEKSEIKPKFIITKDINDYLKKLKVKDPKVLVLYISNSKKFGAAKTTNLFLELTNMQKYKYGSKYSPSDILNTVEDNPDGLFYLLNLLNNLFLNYANKKFGEIIICFQKYKKIFNFQTCVINNHKGKTNLAQLLKDIYNMYNNDITIKNFILFVKEKEFIRTEYCDEILLDSDYENLLEVKMEEIHNLVNFNNEPNVSTQHGVKGESHESVVFVAENSNNPTVKMDQFFELWSKYDICLNDFNEFYYRYKDFIVGIEKSLRLDFKTIKSPQFKENETDITKHIKKFNDENSGNCYFESILQFDFGNYLSKTRQGVGDAKKCFKLNNVFGVLAAYKLFYVGCSRAKKNLTVLIEKTSDSDFSPLIKKVKECGFCL
jgi:DNA helicase-2/ATP-dependent DNA helicase PcrA